MSRYGVYVERQTRYMVDVEADTLVEARSLAEAAAIPESAVVVVDVDVRVRFGEPWVLGWSGEDPGNSYLGRPDQYLETKDLLVFKRALGHVFSKEEVLLLRQRTERTIGAVLDCWNGAGTSALSIRLQAPFGKLTDDQVAMIMAPKEAA